MILSKYFENNPICIFFTKNAFNFYNHFNNFLLHRILKHNQRNHLDSTEEEILVASAEAGLNNPNPEVNTITVESSPRPALFNMPFIPFDIFHVTTSSYNIFLQYIQCNLILMFY